MRKQRDTRGKHEGFQFFWAKRMQDYRETTPTITTLLVADGMKRLHGLDKEGKEISVGLNTAITEKIIRDQESVRWAQTNNATLERNHAD
ncbi:unnamed protein product [Dovyalis caffra]|uniref:Uncharacterized protein n=1 Tax=Dovyalis caffra TaxID=77055 RepID=A0AAV1QWX4_9ROSI|nr:unnamed protein product [Dovyalis caffra]